MDADVGMATRTLTRTRWWVLAVVTVVQVTAAFATQGLSALTGTVHDAFGLSGVEVGFMVTAVGAAPVLSLFVVGDLVDRRGERWVLAGGSVVMTCGLVGAALAPTYPVVLAFLLLAGVGYSTVQPGGSKSISVWFPPERRGVAMGIRQAGQPIGGAAAAAVLPLTAHAFGWRAAFACAAIIALAGGAVFTAGYRHHPQSSPQPVPAPPPPSRPNTERISTPAATEQAPIPVAAGESDPIEAPSDRHGLALVSRLTGTLRQPWMRPILCSGVPLVGLQFGLTAYLMLFARERFHLPLSRGALLLGLLQVAGVVGRVGLAAWTDRDGRSRMSAVRLCMVATAGMLVVVSLLPASTSEGWLVVAVLALGVFGVGWYGPWVAHIADVSPPEVVGKSLGAAMAANQVAIVTVPPALGLLHDISGSYLLGWWLFAGIIAAGALATRRS